MATVDVRGDIVTNNDRWIYDWLGWEATSPNDIKAALEGLGPGETLTVLINSGGGDVFAGQEIFSLLYGRGDVEIKIQSMAGSAASVIAMAGRSEISPVAMIMIHNVSMHGAAGDYHAMQKNAEILKRMDEALASAYVSKTGRPAEEILRMMDHETWLTADRAVEMGFVDTVAQEGMPSLTDGICGQRLTDEVRERVIREKEAKDRLEEEKRQLLDDLDLYGV